MPAPDTDFNPNDPQTLASVFASFFTDAPYLRHASVAVGVSGGPDSMALIHALAHSDYTEKPVHALIVDHGLRAGSHQEAQATCESLQSWPQVTPQILRWEGKKPHSRIQESARNERYKLLLEKAKELGCAALFLAHQQDDVAETVLMRLARGSGPKGLAGLRPLTTRENMPIARPLLSVPRKTLAAYCQLHKIPFINDPSNTDPKFERARLREAIATLPDADNIQANIATSARRIMQMDDTLEYLANQILQETRKDNLLQLQPLLAQPEGLSVRVLIKAIEAFRDAPYPVSLESSERLLPDFLRSRKKISLALGGVLLTIAPKEGLISFKQENATSD